MFYNNCYLVIQSHSVITNLDITNSGLKQTQSNNWVVQVIFLTALLVNSDQSLVITNTKRCFSSLSLSLSIFLTLSVCLSLFIFLTLCLSYLSLSLSLSSSLPHWKICSTKFFDKMLAAAAPSLATTHLLYRSALPNLVPAGIILPAEVF